eukprot:TRINITY_DN17151_c0_g1_i1.p1 TRINITY_DN17151_c0_g1~~TRINITY_DN17151_c0_g1_i1.p1  ORF type:complete len:227 (-),score=35.84 TRINITY_DN17151_c0_g1_i1:504-1184(-)
MAPAVRCTILGTAPCSLREASAFVKRFAESDFLPGDGVTASYVRTVSMALRQKVAREKELVKQTQLPPSTNSVLQGSQLKPTIGVPSGREQGVSQGRGAVVSKDRKQVSAGEHVVRKSEIRGNVSVAPKLSQSASGDGVHKEIVTTDQTGSRSRKRKQQEMAAPLENSLAASVTEAMPETQDRGEERRLDWKKVRSAECQPVTEEQDHDHTLNVVKPSNRKRRKRN